MRVKPLVWFEARVSDKWDRFSAETIFGNYEALEWSNGGYGGTFAPVANGDRGVEFNAPSIQAAKDVCLKDYTMRLSELLEVGNEQEQ